jgi:hypothetical protein
MVPLFGWGQPKSLVVVQVPEDLVGWISAYAVCHDKQLKGELGVIRISCSKMQLKSAAAQRLIDITEDSAMLFLCVAFKCLCKKERPSWT